MLQDAANRMECDDLWQDGEYTDEQFDALISGALKVARAASVMQERRIAKQKAKEAQ